MKPSTNTTKKTLHCALCFIKTSKGYLIQRRPWHDKSGGKWEIAGGKIEANETPKQAIIRELYEELGIVADIKKLTYLRQFKFSKKEHDLVLELFLLQSTVRDFYAKEGQQLAFLQCFNDPQSLRLYDQLDFLDNFHWFWQHLVLPNFYAISPSDLSCDELLLQAQRFMESGGRLYSLRVFDPSSREHLARELRALASFYGAKVLIAHDLDLARRLHLGVHISSQQLLSLRSRPLVKTQLCAASAHNLQEAQHSQTIGLDFITLSPIAKMNVAPYKRSKNILSQDDWYSICSQVVLPVYALGGMQIDDIFKKKFKVFQGIAGISCFKNLNQQLPLC